MDLADNSIIISHKLYELKLACPLHLEEKNVTVVFKTDSRKLELTILRPEKEIPSSVHPSSDLENENVLGFGHSLEFKSEKLTDIF